jgi:hypothetical protein
MLTKWIRDARYRTRHIECRYWLEVIPGPVLAYIDKKPPLKGLSWFAHICVCDDWIDTWSRTLKEAKQDVEKKLGIFEAERS